MRGMSPARHDGRDYLEAKHRGREDVKVVNRITVQKMFDMRMKAQGGKIENNLATSVIDEFRAIPTVGEKISPVVADGSGVSHRVALVGKNEKKVIRMTVTVVGVMKICELPFKLLQFNGILLLLRLSTSISIHRLILLKVSELLAPYLMADWLRGIGVE